jgi:hypothetical protein
VGGAPGGVLYGGSGDNFVFHMLKASPARHPAITRQFSEWSAIPMASCRSTSTTT